MVNRNYNRTNITVCYQFPDTEFEFSKSRLILFEPPTLTNLENAEGLAHDEDVEVHEVRGESRDSRVVCFSQTIYTENVIDLCCNAISWYLVSTWKATNKSLKKMNI